MRTKPRFTPVALKANQAVVDLLGRIAKQKEATPAQIALAWLPAQNPWIVPIPGTTKLHRLEENLGAANVELRHEDPRDIESASSNIRIEGARYREWLQPLSGRSVAAGAFSKTDLNAVRRDRRIRHFDSNQRAITSELWATLP